MNLFGRRRGSRVTSEQEHQQIAESNRRYDRLSQAPDPQTDFWVVPWEHVPDSAMFWGVTTVYTQRTISFRSQEEIDAFSQSFTRHFPGVGVVIGNFGVAIQWSPPDSSSVSGIADNIAQIVVGILSAYFNAENPQIVFVGDEQADLKYHLAWRNNWY